MRLQRFLRSLGYAFSGLRYAWRTQPNMRTHVVLAAVALAGGAALQLTSAEWLALVLVITAVLMAELLNTAVEAVVDLVTTAQHPLAKVAKDTAAAAVVMAALAAIVVGAIVFVPKVWARLEGIL